MTRLRTSPRRGTEAAPVTIPCFGQGWTRSRRQQGLTQSARLRPAGFANAVIDVNRGMPEFWLRKGA